MRSVQRLLVHGAVLAVAVLGAGYFWTRDKDTAGSVVADVTVWGGKPADVQKIVFESKARTTRIESRKDEVGRWFEGTVSKQAPPPPAPKPKPKPDAGPDGSDGEASEAPVEAVKPPTVVQVISVKAAEKIAEAVAPLKAVREIGRVPGDLEADFGLAEPEGTLTLTIGGNERKLVVGAAAPGGADRYVRNAATELVYAVRGDFLRDLMSGETVLNERDLHGFEDEEIKSVRILSGGKSREILRSGAASAAVWSDPATPEKPEETVSNWMAKVARLRPTEYVDALPGPAEANLLLRLEYVGKKGDLGFLEVYRFGGAEEKKSDWFIRTERTRKFAKVFGATAEQVEQDLEALLR
jgi:hypothetical protein